jgi:hypothetical protein
MRVREPIQVYLSEEERAGLDRAAREQGISRSEALRRALRALTTPRDSETRDLARSGHLTPALAPPGPPPPRKPVAPLEELLAELADDRSDR